MDLTKFEKHRRRGYLSPVTPRLCTIPTAIERAIATLLATEVNGNDALGEREFQTMTAFHALERPSIDVTDYVKRLSQYGFASAACLLAAFYYVKRTVRVKPELALTSLSVHRLLITAVVLAAKYFDDITYSMGYYAKVGGLPVKELAFLELEMLSYLDFRLHISPADFHILEQDVIVALDFVPRSPLATDAQEQLKTARIPGERNWYCEAMHDDDEIGLWQPNPTPEKRMLISMEHDSSPCRTPRATSPCSLAEYDMTPSKLQGEDGFGDLNNSDNVDGQHSGPLHKFLSTSTIDSDRSGSPSAVSPERCTNMCPNLFRGVRPYPDSFPRPVPSTSQYATALEVYPSSPPTPESSSYDSSWGAQALFEQQVRAVIS